MAVDIGTDAYLTALQRELRGYLAKGRDPRAADVQAEIARVTGHPVEKASRKAPETAGGSKPHAR